MKKKWTLAVLTTAIISGAFYYSGYYTEYFPTNTISEANSTGSVIRLSEVEDPLYLPLDPPFIVNFIHQDTLRYLQISLEVMYHDQEILNKVNEHMPAIRNALILLLSDQEFETLSSLSGKQNLRQEMKTAINTLISPTNNTDTRIYDAGEIYFTNFVMQ